MFWNPSLRQWLVLASLFTFLPLAAAQEPKPDAPANNEVHVEMKNVAYHFSDQFAVRIIHLQGKLLPTTPGEVPVFDNPSSFTLAVESAQIAIPTDSLAYVLNNHAFARKDAPVKDISIQTKGDKLVVKGKLASKGDMPFESLAAVSLDESGEVRLHMAEVKAAHLPVKGLMDLLGIDVADLISTKKVQGVRTEKDDLLIDPQRILPAPAIQGTLSNIQVRGDELVQTFGPAPAAFRNQSGNYMAYWGGTITFGKLTMKDADLVLVDMDPRDAFDFSLDRYKEQLVAGYTKTTEDFGLRAYTKDLNKLQPAPAAARGKSKKKQ